MATYGARLLTSVYPMDSHITGTDSSGLPLYDRAYSGADLRDVYRNYFTDGCFITGPGAGPDGTHCSLYSDGTTIYLNPGWLMARGLLIHIPSRVPLIRRTEVGSNYAHVIVAARFNDDQRDARVSVFLSKSARLNPTRNAALWQLVLHDINPGGTTWTSHITEKSHQYCGAVGVLHDLDTADLTSQVAQALRAFDLKVGTVATLPAGTSATVKVRKVAGQGAVIDYGIPRGAQGPAGKDGGRIWFGSAAPANPVAGTTWFHESVTGVVDEIRTWQLAGGGTYPSASTWPGADLRPTGTGSWQVHKLAAGVMAS